MIRGGLRWPQLIVSKIAAEREPVPRSVTSRSHGCPNREGAQWFRVAVSSVTAVVGGACAESIATALPNTRTAVAKEQKCRLFCPDEINGAC
jgi:hypothetical protein